jgi:hypothetical protein
MKRKPGLILLFLFLLIRGFAQEIEPLHGIGLTVISQVNQGSSYITFPTDIGNIEPLMFEANLIPNFYIRKSKNARLMGVFTPQIILRMYDERSYPVRTPSYIPQVTVYYMLTEFGSSRNLSLYGRFAHHSNGQDGDFFLENGEVNLLTGDFSRNYFETGFIKTYFNTRFNAYQFFKTSIEIHPQGWGSDELEGIYRMYRWHNAISIFKLPIKETMSTKNNADISIKGEATWMFGDVNDLNAISTERLNLGLTFYYHPKFLEDIGLFVQYYHGTDYYNMYFGHRLDVLRFGLMTEKLRF